jgi:hypothetical protein
MILWFVVGYIILALVGILLVKGTPVASGPMVQAAMEEPALIDLLKDLKFSDLTNPILLSVVVSVVMQSGLKAIIETFRCWIMQWLTGLPPEQIPEDWQTREAWYWLSLVFVSGVFCFILWQQGHIPDFGTVVLNSIISAAASMGVYETIKNAAKPLGGDIQLLGWKWAH